MARMTMSGNGDVHVIAHMLAGAIQGSGLSCELVDTVQRNMGAYTVYAMIFDKYFMRVSNRASLTVVVTGDHEHVSVDAVGAGGGQGALFRFSWGAEESFVDSVARILRERAGWR